MVRAKREDSSSRGADGVTTNVDHAGGQTGSHMSQLSETDDPNYCPPTREDAQGDEDDGEGDEEEEEEEEEEEPLNSGDDVSEEEPDVLFQSENVVVCQYDKIHRSRNKWKFCLKDGIMAIHGRDHIFQKATGEAEW
ncbi:unnamed protein product [Schistocephalus solidus]|uniref:Transcription initiation factor IIA subunit 1 n=1 Tax=Schistocephalus solidus TaxID=70667 RepID=A0A183SFX0_SCHSO|nr:unnamed protein product [Schistocephalus solidus]